MQFLVEACCEGEEPFESCDVTADDPITAAELYVQGLYSLEKVDIFEMSDMVVRVFRRTTQIAYFRVQVELVAQWMLVDEAEVEADE